MKCDGKTPTGKNIPSRNPFGMKYPLVHFQHNPFDTCPRSCSIYTSSDGLY